MTIGSLAPINFQPDIYPVAPKISFSFRPTVHLERWMHEDVSLTSTIRHESTSAIVGGAANTSQYAGDTFAPQQTIIGVLNHPPYLRQAFTSIDLRLDWRNIYGSNFSFAVMATNIANTLHNVASSTPVFITGTGYAQFDEPRMVWATVSYKF